MGPRANKNTGPRDNPPNPTQIHPAPYREFTPAPDPLLKKGVLIEGGGVLMNVTII